MAEPEIAQKSPITVEVEKGNTYFWCTCGKSTAQPFCDGSHKGSEFTPLKYAAEESGQKYFCACKRTGGQPFCDGSHKQL